MSRCLLRTSILCRVAAHVPEVCVRLQHWCAVMEAGFRLHRIGRFSSGEGCAERPGHPRVYLDFPPKDDPALINEYHNRLMQLCGLPFSALAKAVTERTSKGEKRQSQAAGATRSAGEASAVDKPSGPLVEVPVPGLQSDLPASVRRPEPLGNRLRRGSGEMAASSAASQDRDRAARRLGFGRC